MAKAKLELLSLHCTATEDNLGADEPYLKVGGTTVWGPSSLNNGQTASLQGVPALDFSGQTTIQLYDQDTGFLDPDDNLGTITISAANWSPNTQTGQFQGDGADYTLTYKITIVGAPDGKEPRFPFKTEGYFGGNPGYVWVTLESSGYYTVTIRGKHSGVTGTSRYSCAVVITGYRNGQPNVVLNKPSTRTNTVGANSATGVATKDVSFSDFTPVAAEDVKNIRNITVLFGKEVTGQNFKDAILNALEGAGVILDEADALYKKWKNSEIGQAVELAIAAS